MPKNFTENSSFCQPWERPTFLVPGTGVEPAHPFGYKVLNLACLPISPPRLVSAFTYRLHASLQHENILIHLMQAQKQFCVDSLLKRTKNLLACRKVYEF